MTHIVPGAEGWQLIQSNEPDGHWTVRALTSLEEAVALLKPEDDFVLGLPVSAILAQRLKLPALESAEFAEMVRIQMEKALPFAAEEMTSAFETIEEVEGERVISAVAIQNSRLDEIAAPLLANDLIPRQVTVYAAARGATHAADSHALLIFPEGGALIAAITENGKLSFARTLDGMDAAQLEAELPQLAMNAELQGIDSSFANVFLDEKCYELRGVVESLLASRTQLIGVETPPAATELNLLPQTWRVRRQRFVNRGEWRKRLIIAAGAYAAVVAIALIYFLFLKFQVARLDKKIARDAPQTDFVKVSDANWKALAPAVDPHFYPVEILLHLYESLPSPDVQITTYNQSARQISVEGEASTAALAYQFAEKVKKNAELKSWIFTMADPRILPANSHAQFRLEGKPK